MVPFAASTDTQCILAQACLYIFTETFVEENVVISFKIVDFTVKTL